MKSSVFWGMRFCLVAICVVGLSAFGCGDSGETGAGGSTTTAAQGGAGGTAGAGGGAAGMGGTTDTGGMGGSGGAVGGMGGSGGMAPFALTSSAYAEGEKIPTIHECGPPVTNGPGDNVSPQLSWTPGPAGTKSYAIVMHDLDFMNLVHWVIYDIPADVTSLPENIPRQYQPASVPGAKQAEIQNAFYGYLGPCSPNSVNTYQITVHALGVDTLPGVDKNTPEKEIAPLIEGMALASASLSGES